MITVESGNKPAHCWVSDVADIEQSALEQITNVCNLPFLFKHVAIMPDVHCGYGVPIGCVFAATGNVILPSAVGVDIGCGMRACKSDLDVIHTSDLKKIMGLVRERVPVGFAHNKTIAAMPPIATADRKVPVVHSQWESASYQLGSLGGGNHFIEFQKDEDGFLWIMIHSGSRNLGKKIADHYTAVAKELNARWYSSIPAEHDLAFLPLDTEDGKEYKAEMEYALDFARANRALMMDRIMACVREVIGKVEFEPAIDVHHNYAQIEHHMGQNVMVHRKGATFAGNGHYGIIPGSQGTASYIVCGKGNVLSFNSCSHGAGRKMGRKQAQRELDLEHEKQVLDEQGIIHAIRGKSDLDEASGAYKDIDVVMENQSELVEIVHRLKPVGVIKG